SLEINRVDQRLTFPIRVSNDHTNPCVALPTSKVAGLSYSFGRQASSSALAWLSAGSGLADVEIAKHMYPCSLAVQVKQILQTCRLFSGMRFPFPGAQQPSSWKLTKKEWWHHECSIKKHSQGPEFLGSNGFSCLQRIESLTLSFRGPQKAVRMLSAVSRLSAPEHREPNCGTGFFTAVRAHTSIRRSTELPLGSEPSQRALHGRHPPREKRLRSGGRAAGEAAPCVSECASVPVCQSLNPWDVMLCVSGTAIACENALVVAIICYSPALRTPMFVLVGSLATADLLAGLGLILNFVFQYVIRSETVSLLTVGFLVASFAASVSSLLAITVDRYLSLYNALTYYSERTVLCIHTMLAGAWGVSLCLGLLPVLGWNCLHDRTSCSVVRPLTKSNVTLLSASFFLIFLIMLHLYIEICKIVCRHAHQIALQQHFLTASHYVTTKKGVSTLAIILGTFGASWLPFAIYCVVGDPDYPSVYTYATLLPATYNSMINPIIYAYRNQEIQRSMWVLFCGCFQAKVSFRSRSPSDV
ncbi:G-protein coupled receptor 6, partial [Cyanistes caeruleus]